MIQDPILQCPITDISLERNSSIRTDKYFEYSLTYNKKDYNIRLALIDNWKSEDIIKPDNKFILQGLLFNNEWPIESETIITPQLLSKIIRFGEYPRSFEEKINYYLLKCFKEGGSEYNYIRDNRDRPLIAFATNDEFLRILRALYSKNLFVKESNILLTEEGVNYGKQLFQENLSREPKKFTYPQSPKIYFVATNNDSFYADKLKEFISHYGISVISHGYLSEDYGNSSAVLNAKSDLYKSETDYVIFIKSVSSDRSNTFGAILEIAFEAHSNTNKSNFDFIHFAFVDDSDLMARPRMENYNSQCIDFRIITQRKELLRRIQQDWEKRGEEPQNSKAQYDFPTLPLTSDEKIWLNIVYEKFIHNEKFVMHQLFSKVWDKFPKEFDPNNINPFLAISGGGEITLFGICHIHPESNLIRSFDKVMYAIRNIITNDSEVSVIKSEQIQSKVSDITSSEILLVLKLIWQLGNYATGMGTNGDFSSSINIDNEVVYNKYRNYSGVENLIDDIYKRSLEKQIVSEETTNHGEILNQSIDWKEVHSFKTEYVLRDKKNINPVMGVLELANDLSNIINSLPIETEKGQMIGIFGKWGRGKTFLLNEIWNILKDKKETSYVKIEYHAWKYQETPASWAYLYEKFVESYLEKKSGIRNLIEYYKKLIRLNYARFGSWPIIKFVLALLVAVLIPIFSIIKLEWYSALVIPVSLILIISYLRKSHQELSTKALDLIRKYSFKHSFKAELGSQANIQDELIKLMKVWISSKDVGKKKILLIVEDIDRCCEEKIIQNIDALRVMLEDDEIAKRVIIITAIDERILKNAIALKYTSLQKNVELNQENQWIGNEMNIEELISEYLDKVFISAIKLGGLTDIQRIEYINELLKQEVSEKVLSQVTTNEKNENLSKELIAGGIPKKIVSQIIGEGGIAQMKEALRKENVFVEQTGESYDLAIRNGDFVNKDGDYALQDLSGNITSKIEIESKIKDRIIKQNKFEKLTSFEVLLIRQIVQNWEGATPRKIRIIYYRYLLCKNLLISKYILLERVNIWQDKKGLRILMLLLLHRKPQQIAEEKSATLFSIDEEVTISVEQASIKVYRVDYLFLLEILELIIAY